MTRKSWIARTLTAGVAAAAIAAPASAGLLPVSVTVTPEGDNFRWTYAIVLPTDMKLQAGNFFTIYDFHGYVPGGEMAPDGWEFVATTGKTGPTPDRLTPADDPNVTNLTWRYTGETIPSGQIGLGNFWAVSQIDEAMDTSFTARTNRTSDGLVDSNITDTQVPTGDTTVPPPPPPPPPPAETPEPGTLLLAGLGLPLVGLARAARRKKDQA